MNEWINVKKTLPKPKERVLVYSEKGVFSAHIDNSHWFIDPIASYVEESLVDGITHWTELPKPPENDNE